MEDSIHFFQTEPIGKTGNVETHLFQVSATGDLNTAITEWTAFDDDVYNAFVPYYPMLTTDTADVYKVSVHKVTRSDEQPTEGIWYQDAKGRYYTYPDDWTDSFYGVRDALSNLLTYGSNGNQVTAKDQAAAKASSGTPTSRTSKTRRGRRSAWPITADSWNGLPGRTGRKRTSPSSRSWPTTPI